MQVDLAGHVALLADEGGGVAQAIAAALQQNGAQVVRAPGDDAADVAAIRDRFGRLDDVVVLAAEDAAAATRLIRAAAETMRAARSGRILALVSVAALVPLRGDAARAASHGGLVMLVRALALELAEADVRVNAIAMGLIGDAGTGELPDRRMLSHVALGRAGTTADIADAALFMLDPDNSYMTGHVLTVDGGWSAGYGRDF